MDDTYRPILGLDIEAQIEAAQHQTDQHQWHRIKELQVTTPAKRQSQLKVFPILTLAPPRPKSPNKLRQVLADYARLLFESEATFYPNDPRLGHWLNNLAERVVTRIMETVAEMEATTRGDVSLDHHGLTQTQMRETMHAALVAASEEQVKAHLANALKAQIRAYMSAVQTKVQPSATEQRQAPPTDVARRKAFVEPILTEKGWSILDWAHEAEVAYHTAADYLSGTKNPYRSTRVKLARALGATANQLPE